MKKPAADMKQLAQCVWWSAVLSTTRTIQSYLATQRNVQFWFLGCFNLFPLSGKLLRSLGSKTDQVGHYKPPYAKMQSLHSLYRFLCFLTTKSLPQLRFELIKLLTVPQR